MAQNESSSEQLDLYKIPRYKSRAFVPDKADLTDPVTVTSLLTSLVEMPITSSAQLEDFLMKRSELLGAIDQASTILYIRMTCQTDDVARVEKYQDFIQNVAPKIAPLAHEMDKKYVQAIKDFPLDPDFYGVYTKELQTDIEIFRQENIDLFTDVALLSQEYQTVTGAMTAEFDGQEQTLTQIGKHVLDPDRSKRELAWRTIASRRLQDSDKIDELFDKMLTLRNQIAKNAGFANFRDFMFKAYHRFDYTPDDCKQYHRTVKKLLVPLLEKLYAHRKSKMKLNTLKPWDTKVDPLGRAPLKPFSKAPELVDGVQNIFNSLDPELASHFDKMSQMQLLDLENRKGKAPGGYQSALSESRLPFIFMNAVGLDSDLRTLLHEAGHAFHSFEAAHFDLLAYRHAPMEFCEVASMSMELLADPYIGIFYNEQDAIRSRLMHLEQIIDILPWVATIDQFQHWIYENPTHSRAQRADAWKEIYSSLGGSLIDYDGFEQEMTYIWHRQLHIFEVPFYYMEYAIAQLGALQIWLNAKNDPGKALRSYRRALSLGGSRPLPELFGAADIRFGFSEEIIAPLVEAISKELESLE